MDLVQLIHTFEEYRDESLSILIDNAGIYITSIHGKIFVNFPSIDGIKDAINVVLNAEKIIQDHKDYMIEFEFNNKFNHSEYDYDISHNVNINTINIESTNINSIDIYDMSKYITIYNNRIKHDNIRNISITSEGIQYVLHNDNYRYNISHTKEEYKNLIIINYSGTFIVFEKSKSDTNKKIRSKLFLQFPYECPIYKNFIEYNQQTDQELNIWTHRDIPIDIYYKIISHKKQYDYSRESFISEYEYEVFIKYLKMIELYDLVLIDKFDFNIAYLNNPDDSQDFSHIYKLLIDDTVPGDIVIFNVYLDYYEYHRLIEYKSVTKELIIKIIDKLNNPYIKYEMSKSYIYNFTIKITTTYVV